MILLLSFPKQPLPWSCNSPAKPAANWFSYCSLWAAVSLVKSSLTGSGRSHSGKQKSAVTAAECLPHILPHLFIGWQEKRGPTPQLGASAALVITKIVLEWVCTWTWCFSNRGDNCIQKEGNGKIPSMHTKASPPQHLIFQKSCLWVQFNYSMLFSFMSSDSTTESVRLIQFTSWNQATTYKLLQSGEQWFWNWSYICCSSA